MSIKSRYIGLLLNTVRWALSCNLSSLRLSDALQKCQTVLEKTFFLADLWAQYLLLTQGSI